MHAPTHMYTYRQTSKLKRRTELKRGQCATGAPCCKDPPPVGAATPAGLSGHVRPVDARPSFTGGIGLCLKLEFSFADYGDWSVGCQQRKGGFKRAAEDSVLVATGQLWLRLEAWKTDWKLCRISSDRNKSEIARGWGWEEGDWLQRGTDNFSGCRKYSVLIEVVITRLYMLVKICRTVCLKRVNSTVCKL